MLDRAKDMAVCAQAWLDEFEQVKAIEEGILPCKAGTA